MLMRRLPRYLRPRMSRAMSFPIRVHSEPNWSSVTMWVHVAPGLDTGPVEVETVSDHRCLVDESGGVGERAVDQGTVGVDEEPVELRERFEVGKGAQMNALAEFDRVGDVVAPASVETAQAGDPDGPPQCRVGELDLQGTHAVRDPRGEFGDRPVGGEQFVPQREQFVALECRQRAVAAGETTKLALLTVGDALAWSSSLARSFLSSTVPSSRTW